MGSKPSVPTPAAPTGQPQLICITPTTTPNCESAAAYVLNNWLPPGAQLKLLYDSKLYPELNYDNSSKRLGRPDTNAQQVAKMIAKKGPTLTIVESEGTQGRRVYGGFTDIPWDTSLVGSKSIVRNGNSFLFSILGPKDNPPTRYPVNTNMNPVAEVTHQSTFENLIFGASFPDLSVSLTKTEGVPDINTYFPMNYGESYKGDAKEKSQQNPFLGQNFTYRKYLQVYQVVLPPK